MNDLESDLSRIPMRPAPQQWRAEILRAARAAVPEPSEAWWHRWLATQPLAIGAAWLLIVLLRLATPEEMNTPSPAGMAQWQERVRAQEQLVAELFDAPSPKVSQAPPPHGAMLSRRSIRFV